jgi:hypothetical protein
MSGYLELRLAAPRQPQIPDVASPRCPKRRVRLDAVRSDIQFDSEGQARPRSARIRRGRPRIAGQVFAPVGEPPGMAGMSIEKMSRIDTTPTAFPSIPSTIKCRISWWSIIQAASIT